MMILSIWSWSLLQFTLVLTATKERKDRSGVLNRKTTQQLLTPPKEQGCCTPDVYGIIISIMLQDAPFLVLRMLLIFKYGVLSYTNMFFTCKNTLVLFMTKEIKNDLIGLSDYLSCHWQIQFSPSGYTRREFD